MRVIPSEASVEDRLRQLIDAELEGRPDGDTLGRLSGLCRVVAKVVLASGAGVSLMGSDGSAAVATASDAASAAVEELQLVLGEGPCLDAYTSRSPVLAGQLGATEIERWPAYAPAARDQGVQAVFAFPLLMGNSCLGVLDIYRDRPGSLSVSALDEASIFARLAMVELLDQHESVSSWLTGDDRDGGENGGSGPLNYRLVVHQAIGFVMAQLGVGVEEAMLRLRAHSFASNRPISQVADDIVEGRLVLDRDVD